MATPTGPGISPQPVPAPARQPFTSPAPTHAAGSTTDRPHDRTTPGEIATAAPIATRPPGPRSTDTARRGPRAEGSRHRRGAPPCRRYLAGGCEAGSACRFAHYNAGEDGRVETNLGGRAKMKESQTSAASSRNDGQSRSMPGQNTPRAQVGQAVTRPTPPAETRDPCTFQINQIKRRFAAKKQDGEDGSIVLQFGMPPSDPDFPFTIDTLQCELKVGAGFPDVGTPTLRITNPEMERGYQLNVERGFAGIWNELRQKTLLNAMKLLDRRLEALLTEKKMDTIKMVPNAGPKAMASSSGALTSLPDAATHSVPANAKTAQAPPRPSFQQLEEAAAKRQADVQHLQQRLGRHPQFKSEADNTIFTVPVTPRKSDALPAELRNVDLVRLIVPKEYAIEPPSIELLGAEGMACRNVEAAFARRASEHPDMTLLAHVNYLAQNMASMAIENEIDVVSEKQSSTSTAIPEPTNPTGTAQDSSGGVPIHDSDKDHIVYIQRPPEWDDASSDSFSDVDYDSNDSVISLSDDNNTDAAAPSTPQPTSSAPRETGILLSLPSLTLHNTELLELTSLSLTIKCDRCKESHDIHNLKPSLDPTSTPSSTNGRTIPCRKCNNPLFLALRPDLLHAASTRAAYLDAESCTPLALLPSSFTPTCANCSNTATPVVAAPGPAANLAICRACHAHLSFSLPEVRFLRVGASSVSLPLRAAKRPRENLGITPGTELPLQGTCRHYRKSHRWFRFSCCGAVYPCDKCHDDVVGGKAGDGHVQELATRMICGFCSREQVFRPGSCGICGKDVVRKRGQGFWEGGKGTRDPMRMNRKDPRKWKLRRVKDA